MVLIVADGDGDDEVVIEMNTINNTGSFAENRFCVSIPGGCAIGPKRGLLRRPGFEASSGFQRIL